MCWSKAQSPWLGAPSGAVGRCRQAIVLAMGNTPNYGKLPDGSYEKLGTVAGHSLLRLSISRDLTGSLRALASRGHPIAGHDRKTKRFFAQKAGLLRPFVERQKRAMLLVQAAEAEIAFRTGCGNMMGDKHVPKAFCTTFRRPVERWWRKHWWTKNMVVPQDPHVSPSHSAHKLS